MSTKTRRKQSIAQTAGRAGSLAGVAPELIVLQGLWLGLQPPPPGGFPSTLLDYIANRVSCSGVDSPKVIRGTVHSESADSFDRTSEPGVSRCLVAE